MYLQIIVVLHHGLAKDLELLDLLLQLSPRAGGVFEVELRVSELAHQGGTLGTQTCLDGLCVHNQVLQGVVRRGCQGVWPGERERGTLIKAS
jgi:hypothetical protein